MEKSKGEILVFRKKSNKRANGKSDEEAIASNIEDNCSTQLFEPCAHRETHTEKRRSVPDPTWQPTHPYLLWDSLNLDIQSDKKSQGLLQDLEGWVSPGTVTALMAAAHLHRVSVMLNNKTSTSLPQQCANRSPSVPSSDNPRTTQELKK
ncbi:MAG: hypothetical protein Q9192_004362 [Flavoplaca navasiana]